jgi:hypothetical protein
MAGVIAMLANLHVAHVQSQSYVQLSAKVLLILKLH